ncbi:ABC transporter permease [Paraclostridium dentum]|uniref:ABC transporter permease n=1 Tax=Paraclostridium dentum TaxID=2662455 RepID=UPI0014756FA6|nr:ABC transporter permease [Paraclostridium dentum]
MISILKNEFITNEKGTFLLANILIIPSLALIYFASMKVIGVKVDIMSIFLNITLSMLPFFIIILISKVITEEFNNGGMKIYLINPISRNEVLIGKLFFIFINIVITMIIQIVISFIATYVLSQVPGIDSVNDIIYKYLVALIPTIGLISVLFIPGLLIQKSRQTIYFGILILIGINFVCLLLKLNSYSITYVIKNIGDINQNFVGNISISIIYILVGLIISSHIFSNKEIK